jgi:hypothetical protein
MSVKSLKAHLFTDVSSAATHIFGNNSEANQVYVYLYVAQQGSGAMSALTVQPKIVFESASSGGPTLPADASFPLPEESIGTADSSSLVDVEVYARRYKFSDVDDFITGSAGSQVGALPVIQFPWDGTRGQLSLTLTGTAAVADEDYVYAIVEFAHVS